VPLRTVVPESRVLDFLSEDWLEAFHARVGPAAGEAPDGGSCRIEIVVEERLHSAPIVFSIRDGQLESRASGGSGAADLLLRWDLATAWGALSGAFDATRVAAATELEQRSADGAVQRGPMPPFDLARRPEILELPFVPDASLVVQLEFTSAPFGALSCAAVFEHGWLLRMESGVSPGAEVFLRLPFSELAALRRGDKEPLDVLDAGQLRVRDLGTAFPTLLLFGGLLEAPEVQRAQRACSPWTEPLVPFADLFSQEPVLHALQRLAAATCPPLAVPR
jgi:hypothetical protein